MAQCVQQTLLKRVKEAVLLLDSSAEVILYGSRAPGQNRSDSVDQISSLANAE